MEKKKMSLPVQIVLALILGIVVGLIFYFIGKPEITTNYFKPFGTIFVNLLKFIVVPVVLLSMIDGIISMGDMKKVGSVGWKTVAYFLVTTAAACVIGLVFANIFLNAGLFPTDLALTDGQTWDGATSANFMDTLVAIFPSNMWKSFTDANMLQVIVIALMFGGGAWDTVTAFFVGLLIEWVTLLMDKFHMQTLVATLAGGFLAAFLPMAVNRLTGALVVEAAVAGALMPMLPGLAMTNAVQDTMRGDMVSGISSAVSAAMSAVLLAVGALAGTAFLRLLTGGAA